MSAVFDNTMLMFAHRRPNPVDIVPGGEKLNSRGALPTMSLYCGVCAS